MHPKYLLFFVIQICLLLVSCHGGVISWVYETYEKGLKQLEEDGRLLSFQQIPEDISKGNVNKLLYLNIRKELDIIANCLILKNQICVPYFIVGQMCHYRRYSEPS